MSAPQTWPEWPKHMAPDEETAVLAEFDALLASWGVVSFTARELFRVNDRRGDEGHYQIPPRSMWLAMKPTAQLAQRIRTEWAGPVQLVCGFRVKAYNDRKGGAPKSKHMEFAALDITPAKLAPGQTWDGWVALVRHHVELAEKAGAHCGFGIYPKSRFTHIDVGARTASARWIED